MEQKNGSKKCLFLIPSLTNGGAERVMSTIANNLCSDCDVRIVTFTDPDSFYKLNDRVEVVGLGQKVNRKNKISLLFSSVTGGIKLVFDLKKMVKSWKPDAILSFLQAANMIAILVKILGGSKARLVVSERCDPTVRGFFNRWFESNFYSKADVIVCQSKVAASFFDKDTQNKIEIIPNPISADAIPARHTGVRRKTVVGVGRLDGQKNFAMLIKAFSRLPEKFNEYTLEIYGGGNQEAELQQIINSSGLEKRAFLMGVKPNVMHYIADTALYVMSSNFEGFPNALAEAMATGLPVISTDFSTGVARELITDKNGIVIPVGDEDALVNAMEKILGNEQEWENMSVENRKLLDELSEERVMKKWRMALSIDK